MLLFATDESLNILARARTVLADGTFCICQYLWYQVFIIRAEIRTHSFVPVAFGHLSIDHIQDENEEMDPMFFNLFLLISLCRRFLLACQMSQPGMQEVCG